MARRHADTQNCGNAGRLADTHAWIHVRRHVYTQARMYACTHAGMHEHECFDARRHARMHACTHADKYACTHARMRACTDADIHTCTHARMHACTHEQREELCTRRIHSLQYEIDSKLVSVQKCDKSTTIFQDLRDQAVRDRTAEIPNTREWKDSLMSWRKHQTSLKRFLKLNVKS